MESEKMNAKGRISRVTTKYAFVNTDKGTVFCPLAASIPTTEHVPDMTERYKAGDSVHLTAVSQNDKNGCKWRAIKMRIICEQKSSNDIRSDISVIQPTDTLKCIASITRLTETYAYCIYLGEQVFVPGAAFSSTEVTRLNSYLKQGDELELEVRQQLKHNDCKWIAVKATKYIRHSETVFKGHGRINEVSALSAHITTDTHGILQCSILTWSGGDGGLSATWLDELLAEGDHVSYYVAVRENGFEVIAWTARGFLPCEKKSKSISVETQTVSSTNDIVIRAFSSVLPLLLEDKPALQMLYDMN